MFKKRITRKRIGITLALLMSSLLVLTAPEVLLPDLFMGQSAVAQRVRPEGVWQVVYDRLPDFPKENQYVSKETGKVETDNTLVGRFIRYHLYVAGRSPFYRFDWKLTLADYLGLGYNGAFDEASYPSRSTLRTSPVDNDRAAINRLTRAQRDALVQALVDAFTMQAKRSPQPLSAPAPQPAPTGSPATPAPVRGRGGAQLLQP